MTRRQAEVVMALAANGLNTTRGAKAMYMSRSGFDYHVQQIKKITGMDPQDFYDMKVLEEEATRILGRKYERNQHHSPDLAETVSGQADRAAV